MTAFNINQEIVRLKSMLADDTNSANVGDLPKLRNMLVCYEKQAEKHAALTAFYASKSKAELGTIASQYGYKGFSFVVNHAPDLLRMALLAIDMCNDLSKRPYQLTIDEKIAIDQLYVWSY